MHRSFLVSLTSLALAGTLAAGCSDDDPADGNSTQAAGSVC
jgi:hypothetical protein